MGSGLGEAHGTGSVVFFFPIPECRGHRQDTDTGTLYQVFMLYSCFTLFSYLYTTHRLVLDLYPN